MSWVVRYIAALIVLVVGDALWLSYFAQAVFRPTLGAILLDDPRWAAIVLFYLAYSAGILIFATKPAAQTGSAWTAIAYGALFGLFAYGTYDATNLATIKAWTIRLSCIDTAWGALLTALAGWASYAVKGRG